MVSIARSHCMNSTNLRKNNSKNTKISSTQRDKITNRHDGKKKQTVEWLRFYSNVDYLNSFFVFNWNLLWLWPIIYYTHNIISYSSSVGHIVSVYLIFFKKTINCPLHSRCTLHSIPRAQMLPSVLPHAHTYLYIFF